MIDAEYVGTGWTDMAVIDGKGGGEHRKC